MIQNLLSWLLVIKSVVVFGNPLSLVRVMQVRGGEWEEGIDLRLVQTGHIGCHRTPGIMATGIMLVLACGPKGNSFYLLICMEKKIV